MKKSFDYFKTLKDMSECICSMLFEINSGGSINKDSIRFYGLRYELSESLANDFVAPIERNDIYNLSYCLCRQAECLSQLYALTRNVVFYDDFVKLLEQQSPLLHSLGNIKKFNNILTVSKEGQRSVAALRHKLTEFIKTSLKNEKQPLYTYVVLSETVKLCENIYECFCQLEWVAINNI